MSETLDIEHLHRVNDMSLVTLLKMRGFSVQDVVWTGSTCYWVFRVSDGLIELSDEFAAGKALVEPREYNRIFGETKKELYGSKREFERDRGAAGK